MNGNQRQTGLDFRTMEKRSRFDFTAAVIMAYPPSNYENPKTRGDELYVLNSIFFIAMLVVVGIRFYARLCIRKWFGWDDFFILLAVIGATGVTACVMLGTHNYSWDRHIWDIRLHILQPSAKLMFASKILWSFTSNSVRASVMCLFYRLLKHVGMEQYRWILHLNSFYILGIFLMQQLTTVFACRPIRTVWTFPVIEGSQCIDNGAATFIGGVLNTSSEFIVAILPLPVIFTLNVNRHQRNMIIGMLCGGILVVIVGAVRTSFIWQMIVTHDPSWWAMPHWIASEVEMDVAIICACIPAVMPVFIRVFRGGLSAVKQAEPLPSSAGTEAQVSTHRTFFKIKDQDSLATLSVSTVRSQNSTTPTGSQRTIDIEGIKTDGFGYTVTISTGRGTKVRRRWDIRKREWHYYPEQEVSDVEEEDAAVPARRKLSVFSQASGKRKRSGSGPRAGNAEKRTMEVQTEKTFDVRESFHSQKFERGFDYRNPYKGIRHEEDVDVVMQVPEAAISDWSLLHDDPDLGEAPRMPAALNSTQTQRDVWDVPIPSSPAIPSSAKTRKRGSSYETQRYTTSQGQASESTVPKTSSSNATAFHKGSRSYDNIRMGVLPSPSTANFDHSFSRPSQKATTSTFQPPSPPPLPVAALVRRSSSPATQPINSSHLWMTSVLLSHKSDGPSDSSTPDSEPERLRKDYADLEIRNSKGHDRWNNMSIHSSLWAENGSGRSVAMAMQRRRVHPHPRREEVEESDEDFSLPLQQPSPRSSIYRSADSADSTYRPPRSTPAYNGWPHR